MTRCTRAGGGGDGSQQREVAEGADVVFTDTEQSTRSRKHYIDSTPF